MALLEIRNLQTSFFTDNGEVKAVNGISYNLDHGKVLGIVGESEDEVIDISEVEFIKKDTEE